MPAPRVLIHSAYFDYALGQLGGIEEMDDRVGRELHRIALYGDLVPIAPGQDTLRIYGTDGFVRDDGQLIRLYIYFVLLPNGAIELQNTQAVDEDMTGGLVEEAEAQGDYLETFTER